MTAAPLLEEEHRLAVAPGFRGGRYRLLPLDLPPGAGEIEVLYKVEADARIDIGIVDPRGPGPGLPGFRGWSGSARDSFVIQKNWATPGYLPGSLPEGRWHVILGLYVVSSHGSVIVRIVVRRRRKHDPEPGITLHEARLGATEIPGLPSRPPLNLLNDEGWMRGDLHSHSVHSNDADRPIQTSELVAAAEALGFDFLAVTEHNTVSHWPELRRLGRQSAVVLLPAQEVTTYRGHFNAYGAGGLVDFRILDDAGLAEAVAASDSDGRLLSVNHPKSLGPAWEFGVGDAFGAVEAWQAPWAWANGESLKFWDNLLSSGRRIAGIGGSDIHDFYARSFHGLGNPTTWVLPKGKGPRGVINGMREGRVMVSSDAWAPLPVPYVADGGGGWQPACGLDVPRGAPVKIRMAGDPDGRVLRIAGPGGEVFARELHGEGCEVALPPEVGEQAAARGPACWLRAELWERGLFTTGPVSSPATQMASFANPWYPATA